MPLRYKAYCTAENASSRLPICSDAQPRRSQAVAASPTSTLGVGLQITKKQKTRCQKFDVAHDNPR